MLFVKMSAAVLIAAFMLVVPAYGQMMDSEDALEGPIQIGVLFGLTGDISSLAVEARAAVDLGVADFNLYLESQDAGWWLVAVPEDTQTSPVVALEKTQIYKSRNIDIVIGMLASSSVTQAKTYADKNNMLLVSPGSTSPALAIPDDSVYRLIPDDTKQGKAVGALLRNENIDVMIPLWRGDTYGDGLKDAAKESFESHNGMVLDGTRYFPDTSDFSVEMGVLAEQVDATIAEYGADRVAIFAISFDEIVTILQTADNYPSLKQIRWFGAEAIAQTNSLLDDAISHKFANDVRLTATQISLSPGGKFEYVQATLTEKLGHSPSIFIHPAYDTVWVVGYSIMEAGSADPEAIKDVIHEVAAGYEGALSSTILNEAGDLASSDYSIWRVSGNEWVETDLYSTTDDELYHKLPFSETEASAMDALSDGTPVLVRASEIMPGESVSVDVVFANSDDVNYDITIMQEERIILDTKNVRHFGILTHQTDPAESDAPVDIAVTFRGYGQDMSSEETLTFTNIVPEFGVAALVVLAGAVAATAVVTRVRMSYL